MGFLSRISTVAAPARLQASTPGPLSSWWYQTTEGFTLPLDAAGMYISPELALTLSYVHCAVSTISDDFGTMSCQFFRNVGADGRERVRFSDPGIGGLAYRLRWQPNLWQTSKAFWSTLCWQYLLRPAAFAEIVYRPGSNSFVDQLVPRHPDRVKTQRLPSGRLQFKLTEPGGTMRTLTQDEMLYVPNTSSDGLNAISRTQYGAKSISSGLALQDFTRNFFKKGATAGLLATYKGASMGDEAERDLHASISRYVSGVENAGGIMLVPEDIAVQALGINPEKAQLLGLKELSGRDVARLFKMPPHKLFISGTATYASQVQSAQEYATGCQMPIAVEFEQSIQRDLVLAKDIFFAKFNMDYLLRADLKTRMEAYEIGIRSRVLRPSECRVREDLSPDDQLDQLSERDHQPGASKGSSAAGGASADASFGHLSARAAMKASLIIHDGAARIMRRERAAVLKIAQRTASDADAWQSELRAFYVDHSQFVAETLRLHPDVARAYAAQHGSEVESKGVAWLSDGWERHEADELALLAVTEGETIETWFADRRLANNVTPAAITVNTSTPVSIADGAVRVDARTTVAASPPASVVVNNPPRKLSVHIAETDRVTTVQRDAKERLNGTRSRVKTVVDTIEEPDGE
jgi:HK97 family phage portal protein